MLNSNTNKIPSTPLKTISKILTILLAFTPTYSHSICEVLVTGKIGTRGSGTASSGFTMPAGTAYLKQSFTHGKTINAESWDAAKTPVGIVNDYTPSGTMSVTIGNVDFSTYVPPMAVGDTVTSEYHPVSGRMTRFDFTNIRGTARVIAPSSVCSGNIPTNAVPEIKIYITSPYTITAYDSSYNELGMIIDATSDYGIMAKESTKLVNPLTVTTSPHTLTFYAVPGRRSKTQTLSIKITNFITSAGYFVTMNGTISNGTVYIDGREGQVRINRVATGPTDELTVPIAVSSTTPGQTTGTLKIDISYT